MIITGYHIDNKLGFETVPSVEFVEELINIFISFVERKLFEFLEFLIVEVVCDFCVVFDLRSLRNLLECELVLYLG